VTYFDTAVLSSAGGRDNNEDYCGFRMLKNGEKGGCWVVADGLGGHVGGALASRTAVDAALAFYETNPAVSPEAAAGHVNAANQAVLEKQQNEPSIASMRTTLVVLVTSAASAIWAHSGDSRLYHFRAGKIAAQTLDHSVPQRLVDAGEIAPDQIRFHEDRNRLLRSLGAKTDPGTTVLNTPVQIQPGDAFLLASDGFWEWVNESEMEQDLVGAKDASDWLGKMEDRLLARATADNDNYTAVALVANANLAGSPTPGQDGAREGIRGTLRRWIHGPE